MIYFCKKHFIAQFTVQCSILYLDKLYQDIMTQLYF